MSSPRPTVPQVLFFLFVTGFLVTFLIYPVYYVFEQAFFIPTRHPLLIPGAGTFGGQTSFSLEYFRLMLASDVERECMRNSVFLGLAAVLGTSLIAFPLAALSVKYTFRGKGLVTGLMLIPMVMPPFVGVIGMQRILARHGSINILLMRFHGVWLALAEWFQTAFFSRGFDFSAPLPAPAFDGFDFMGGGGFWAIALMQVLHLYPIMYLNVVAALANVDPSLEDAARNMGDSGFRLFRKITLPLLMPGYFAGAILVFVWGFTDLGTPLIFGFRRVLSVRIFDRLSDISVNPMGYASVVLMVLISATAFVVGRSLTGRRSHAMLAKGSVGAVPKPLGPFGSALALAAILLVVCVAMMPHVGVFLTSIQDQWSGTVFPTRFTTRWFRALLTRPMMVGSIRNSLFMSLSATMVDIFLGIGLAVLLVRRRMRGSGLLDVLAMMPLAIPGLVLAFGYLTCFGNTPGLDPRINPIPLLVISYSIRRLPLMLRSVVAGLQQTSQTLEEASLNLGATPGQTLSRITVPLILANVLAGAVLTFSFAMLQVSDSLILAVRPRFYPITKAIYMVSKSPGTGANEACAMGMLAMVLLAAALITAGALMGRRLGEIFRAG